MDPIIQTTQVPEKKSRPWMAVAVIAFLLLLIAPPVIVLATRAAASAPLVSPVAQSLSSDLPNSPDLPNPQSSPYSPSDYIYMSQRYFADAQTLSQNRQQSDDEKKEILGKLQSALDTISEGISLYPKRAELWAERATIYQAITMLSSKALENSLADFEQAHALAPQNPEYTLQLATLYQKYGNSIDKAIYYMSLTQSLKPNDPQVLYDLAKLQVTGGFLKSAQVSFTKLLPLLTDAGQKQQIENELQTVSALLTQAGTSGQSDQLDTSCQSTSSSPPAGLELLKDQQADSRDVVVAAPDEGTSPYQDNSESSAYSGTATIPAGQTSITVDNSNVTDAAPIYVVPTIQTDATLSVMSKKAGSGFIVALDNAQESDIPFQYWVTK